MNELFPSWVLCAPHIYSWYFETCILSLDICSRRLQRNSLNARVDAVTFLTTRSSLLISGGWLLRFAATSSASISERIPHGFTSFRNIHTCLSGVVPG